MESTKARKYEEIEAALAAVDDILEHIMVLDHISSEEELDQKMPDLLASMGKYSMSDRAYLFAWTSPDREVLQMTHEWCAKGVRPTLGEMQHVRISDMPNWAPKLFRGEPIVSADWDREKEHTPEEYALFDGQDIHSLIVIPIFAGKKLNGYIGFDNPAQSRRALSVRLLTSAGGHIGSLQENLIMRAKQEKQRAELERALEDATLNSEIIDSISKIYWLIYRMDLVQGTYEEISAGSEMHRLTGKQGRTVEVFKEVRETFVSPEHQEMMKTFLDTSTLPERLRDTESIAMEYRAASGSWHLARFIVKKRSESGRVTNVLYVVRLIDKQKQLELEYKQKLLATAEDARRANVAKTDFLRRMSHDIRTPINGIQGMVAIAEHYPDDHEKQKECRDKVKEASGFLLDLVNNVLDMNKLESGRIVLEHEAFDLIEVLREVGNIAEMNGQMEGLKISMDYEKIEHTHLIGSPVHFKQILQNIAGNAVKYNRTGGEVRLTGEELTCDGTKATYRFVCKDTGRGMSRSFLAHAFEPFSQEDPNARTSYMGTGLGLSIVEQLVKMMDGTIEVESEPGVGTTFAITLPFEIDASYQEISDTEDVISDIVLEGAQVLLAEDNEINMEIARFILENAGMVVTSARNGKEAVDLFAASAEDHFDLILMDVMMPVMDGLTAAKTIREMNRADARRIPIFAMTANAFTEDMEMSREAGMNEHLSKPLDTGKMLDIMKQYIVSQKKSE